MTIDVLKRVLGKLKKTSSYLKEVRGQVLNSLASPRGLGALCSFQGPHIPAVPYKFIINPNYTSPLDPSCTFVLHKKYKRISDPSLNIDSWGIL